MADNRHRMKNRLGKPRFGDARDKYLEVYNDKGGKAAVGYFPCTSASLSTMPRRPR